MLSRTADSLFWLARYTERAGNVARGLAVASRMAAISARLGDEVEEWRALLTATGGEAGFRRKYPEPTAEAVIHWLIFDPDNPSGILPCFEAARRNARAVRTALTVDMWEALNDGWNHLRKLPPEATDGDHLPDFLGWVRDRVTLFNGAAHETMLRDEAWRFVRLGTMLERADNSARLLDVRHKLLTPEAEGAVDYVQWQAVLRAVSALRSYQWIYRDRLQPRRIAELLILRPELPRSLLSCFGEVAETLEAIAVGQGGRRGECHRLAGGLHAQLRYGRIEAIFEQGLHEFLTGMIARAAELGGEIEAFYIRG
ncbi:alpha-E domain-containing protein [Siccirubricoccus sp. KC 17139]|uniref:Alpha-E domain-containing protein n=1 Tax=Siccirubricoccus soli TaxID=2899147 RepID=A0ABT1D5W5_9PROT|nr:alpha-E domain-containing protein [Siccirubricoccus soli]MCO6417259.1 alpha-E domain-containing protein [Siccirubricoccus soli]MCP2683394.1 alpha-E domain-containing protein [Siccirubricoccus soli]